MRWWLTFAEALAMGMFFLAMAIGYARQLNRPFGSDLRIGEWHHAYLGVMIGGVGSMLNSNVIMIVAVIVTVEDAIQHLRQALTRNIDYRGPFTRAWYWLVKHVS